MTLPLSPDNLSRKRPDSRYQTTGTVERYEAEHPGVRALVEELLRRRVSRDKISQEVKERFGLTLSQSAISRFWRRVVGPAEEAEAAAYRQAHAQARALIEEMKADPSLDAAQIAELMLAQAIVRDRSKLAETDIMALYKEQRERKKLEIQSRALRLRENQVKAAIAEPEGPKPEKQLSPEVIQKIREIYGLRMPTPPMPSALSPRIPDV